MVIFLMDGATQQILHDYLLDVSEHQQNLLSYVKHWMLIYPLHKSTSNHRKIGIWNIFGRSWRWLEWLEPVEQLYKDHQWHTSEDSTMCESKPTIRWKTLRWTRYNSHQGMHKHIPMPWRYFTNIQEPFCLLSDAPSRLSQSYSQFTYLGILSNTMFCPI